MESVLASLGALLLRALPTFFLLLVLHFYLKIIFFKPLDRALKERDAATAGVRKLAEQAIANAERKAVEYEEALRTERGHIYREQEEARRTLRDQQSSAVLAIRREMEQEIAEARARVSREKEAQREALTAQTDVLAEQIAGSVLGGQV